MSRDYLNNVDKIGYGYAEPGSAGHDYGKPDLRHGDAPYAEQHLPTLQHEHFLRWLGLEHPARYLRHTTGKFIPARIWQEWLAEWYALPPDDTFTQLWRSLNRASRDKLYAEADALGRKIYDELNAAYPLEE